MNETPLGERLHIGIFGKRNVGKSSLLNAITGQDIATVSKVKGTTTDPVYKTMEILPIGPVVIIDTAGIDDSGELGTLRIDKTREILRKTNVALLVVDAAEGLTDYDRELLQVFKESGIKYLVVGNKSDLNSNSNMAVLNSSDINIEADPVANNDDGLPADFSENTTDDVFPVSALTGENIYELKEKIAELANTISLSRRLVADIIDPGDTVVLVVPIDKAAPKGRLILPQQQAIRDILDIGATSIITRETELADTLNKLKDKPKLVITDSQVFKCVKEILPADVPLTSFSILMARYKGVLDNAVNGAHALDNINEGDKILIAEGCTHHRQCDDIGTVKLPAWIEDYTGVKPSYEFTAGGSYPEDLSGFEMIIHCGGCMLNDKEMQYRRGQALNDGIPMTNYGVIISYMQGILDRSIAPILDSGAEL